MLRTLLLVGFLGALAVPARAEDKLALLIPNLYGSRGLVVDTEVPSFEQPHFAHFNSAFQTSFTQFNVALAAQLASLPLPSPASGFTYGFDPASGVFTRSTRSFGPILSDRAETIGKGRLAFGTTYQRFTFDTLEGLDLGDVPALFTHDDAAPGTGRADVLTTANSIAATFEQFTAFLSYGLSNRVDVSVAVPMVSAELAVTSRVTIHRIGSADNPRFHFFRSADDAYGTQRQFSAAGTASGIGDITLRLKGTALRRGPTGMALGLDVRLPTGDEQELLGSGAMGMKPFLALSFSRKAVSPHIDLAYQWSGKSVLAGNVAIGAKEKLPDQFLYAAGIDIGLARRLTLALDVLGRHVIDSPRLVSETFRALDERSTFPNIRFVRDSFHVTEGAVGVKINTGGRLLVDFNVLFTLNDNGLRDKATPLLGLEYSF